MTDRAELALLAVHCRPNDPPTARAWEWSVAEAIEGNFRPLRVWRDIGERVGASLVEIIDARVVAWPLQHRVPEVSERGVPLVLGSTPLERTRFVRVLFGERPPYMRVESWEAVVGAADGVIMGVRHVVPLRPPHAVVLDAAGRCPSCGEQQPERLRCRVCQHGERNDGETATATATAKR